MMIEDGTHVTLDYIQERGIYLKVCIDGKEEKEAVECLVGKEGWLLTATDTPHLDETGEDIALYKKTGVVTAEVV